MTHAFPELVDTKRAAEILATTPGRLAEWRYEGKGPVYVKIGRAVRYPLPELEKYLADNTVRPEAS